MHEYTCRLTFEQDEGETEIPPTFTAQCSTYVTVQRTYAECSNFLIFKKKKGSTKRNRYIKSKIPKKKFKNKFKASLLLA